MIRAEEDIIHSRLLLTATSSLQLSPLGAGRLAGGFVKAGE
jgi:hypothetical protein